MAEPQGEKPRRGPSAYMVAVGVAFIALIVVAAINALSTNDSGVLGVGVSGENDPLAEFAVPDARSDLEGDANIAQDDCEGSERPCPAGERRTPACQVDEEGAIRVCDLFDAPLVLSFWFTRGGDCESAQDPLEAAYRRHRDQVNFLSIDVRDGRDKVRDLISEHGWTLPVGIDSDGALSNLYRIGGCPTFLYVYPGGILQTTSIGDLDEAEMEAKIKELLQASRRRAAA